MFVFVLDEIVLEGVKNGVEDVMIGMVYCGCLSVFVYVLEKLYSYMFVEFKYVKIEGVVVNFGWIGDVKYYLGRE